MARLLLPAMAASLLLLLALALLAPAVARRAPRAAGAVLAAPPALLALAFAARIPVVAGGEAWLERWPWVSPLGIDAAFRLDGLSLLFACLVTGIGALVVLYAAAYLADPPRRGRFLGLLLAFMAAMLGLVLADDVFVLFVFWELTTLTSYLLIGFEGERAAARRAALQGLLVTGAGGLALLAGLVLLVEAAGTSAIPELLARGDRVRAHALYGPILALVLLGAFTKSAQVPFHYWLPGAMQAPTPVSAYLHSATMVKAGVYLLARLSPALGGTDAWLAAVTGAGAATLVTGAVMALGQTDLKRMLAYSTVSVLGLLTLLLGLGTPVAARAFAVTLLAHAFYKAALFLVAGNVEHATGTRDVRRLGGLARAMPWTAAGAGVAAVSMAGAPPLFGFLAKETAYEAALEAPRAAILLGPAVVAGAVLLVAVAARTGLEAFRGAPRDTPRTPHEAPPAMAAGPLLLAALGVAAGLLVGPAERAVIAPAAAAVLQAEAPTGLALWHGFTPILGLSVLTLLAGAALYRGRAALPRAAGRARPLARLGPARAHEVLLNATLRFAAWQTAALQGGSLRRWLWITLAAGFGTVGAALLRGRTARPDPQPAEVGLPDLAAVVLVLAGVLGLLRASTRTAALACLGAVGFGVSLLFLLYGAPDLALTQLVVEVLTVLLFLLVLRGLPALAPDRRGGRAADAGLAALGGAIMATLTLVAAEIQLGAPVSGYFLEESWPSAHGRNVVNVILVDFRALDTLGEIVVLATAGLGAYALLRAARPVRRGRPA